MRLYEIDCRRFSVSVLQDCCLTMRSRTTGRRATALRLLCRLKNDAISAKVAPLISENIGRARLVFAIAAPPTQGDGNLKKVPE
uniref:Uncharacterized protein n=1 Tax=Trichuris muris TaxID=70415 RepID=A0A5S6Q6B6_TRIMR